jgi:hypothetical protein
MPMLSYASARGHTFIDRALYLPPMPGRRSAAVRAGRVPAERGFATKPQLVIDMLG